ncbi:hypothetical protein QUF87_18120 [Lysinibacillus pakistanensis]|nr:hypothetical protein [Lysinibacillus pakistanensis]
MRKRSANVAAATRCWHSVVATGRGIHRLSSAISVGVSTPTETISSPVEVGVFC